MKRPAITTLLILGLLLTALPASANYSAHDPREPKPKHLNIESASSTVFWGTYLGFRTKLVRFRVTFYDSVPWRKLAYPRVDFFMDSFRRSGIDYHLELFYLKPVGATKKRLYCWLQRGISAAGTIVLNETQVVAYATGPRLATCTFPRGRCAFVQAATFDGRPSPATGTSPLTSIQRRTIRRRCSPTSDAGSVHPPALATPVGSCSSTSTGRRLELFGWPSAYVAPGGKIAYR